MFKYKVKEQVIMDYIRKPAVKRNEVFIVKYFIDNDSVLLPSSFSHFLFMHYSNCSINTKLSVGYIICGFLNYLIDQTKLINSSRFDDLKNKGLFGLNHHHLASYINYISYESEISNSFQTVKRKEKVLVRFYDYLNSRNITNEDAKVEKVIDKWNGTGSLRYLLVSPLVTNPEVVINYPSVEKDSGMILKDLDFDVWDSFIEFAEYKYPNIALGVAFQFMGGLRLGEVVNLKKKSITVNRELNHLRLNIKDRQVELFKHRFRNERKSQVKCPRENQPVFNFNKRLFLILDKHLEYLELVDVKNKEALFVDRSGNSMSGNTYENVFYNLKNDFISFLKENNHFKLANELSVHRWGTHIGRHIFTNHLINIGAVSFIDGKPNPDYLRILRGDKSPYSAKDYINTKLVIRTVAEKIELMSEMSRIRS